MNGIKHINMDYEKEYKEALERAKRLRDSKYQTMNAKRVAEEIFPVLAESEDERIREWLVDYFKAVERAYIHWDISPERIVAYLEKQKEQIEELSTRLNGVMQEYVKAGKDEEEQEHRLKCYQLFWDALSDSEFFEQKEQKPAEWSEFDRGVLEDAICATDLLGNGESFNKDNPNLAKAFRIAKDWLKSLPERFNLQPKQEEDISKQVEQIRAEIEQRRDFFYERYIKKGKGCVEESRYDECVEILSFIDSLPNCTVKVDGQGRVKDDVYDSLTDDWKPSEEQKKIIGNIRHLIFEHAFENGGVDVNGDYCKDVYQEADDFLKSLRPKHHWKPSEEHMQALINCIIGDDYDIHALVSLASDLKNYII